MPNPCYMLWQDMCMIRLSYDDDLITQIQVCGDPEQQDANLCNPYVCESTEIEDACIIKRSFRCGSDKDCESDLIGIGFRNVEVVDNSEDWFPRLQYYFIL